MKITINSKMRSFSCEKLGKSKDFSFDEITSTKEWSDHGQIRLVHETTNEYGIPIEDILNKGAFTESLKRGDVEWVTTQNTHELNVSIHKLYGLLSGKTEEEVDSEVENLLSQLSKLYMGINEWNHERSTNINTLEQSLDNQSNDQERLSLLKEIDRLRSQEKPYKVPDELSKMYYAARDESKPTIKFSNVTPDAVKQAYGDSLIIQ